MDSSSDAGTSKSHASRRPRDQNSEADSGYGGSSFGGSEYGDAKKASYVPGESNIENADSKKGHHRSPSTVTRRHVLSQVNQLQYNDNRVALGRSISAVLTMLKELQNQNRNRPVFYPVQPVKTDRKKKRMSSAFETSKADLDGLPRKVKRVVSDLGLREKESKNGDETAENVTLDVIPSPLMKDFNVLKLDLKVGTLSSEELVSTLAKSSVASLLEEKIIQTMRHLLALRDRIDDTSSKVLITGDLNSGKSTFCNALLRRKLLPEDQQPCTSVFCEVVDARENNGIEEVHAVGIDVQYDRSDESTYAVFPLKQLEDLVGEPEKYSILKVYVNDGRPVDQSLLRNGVIDISLIDAPGLNMDSYQTTQVFSRQEEIDLVVFVVSAENHFTLSSKEFIWTAAHEKSLVFIVVNRFDNIKDKGKCKKRILDQVADLSPETHKDASEFIHFVSSSEILKDIPSDSEDDDDEPDQPDHDIPHPDFDQLEASLRNFVLEKRSLSKLAPAKKFLINLTQDIANLASSNIEVLKTEKHQVLSNLDTITPEFEKYKYLNVKVSEESEQIVEEVAQKVYDFTRDHLDKLANNIGDSPIVPYASVFNAFDYAIATREAMIDNLLKEVVACESFARKETTQGFNTLKALGVLHLGEQSAFKKVFNDDAMFSHRRDTFARTVYTELSVGDFFDFSFPTIPLLTSGDKKDESSTLTNALTVASVVTTGQLIRSTDVLRNVFTVSQFLDSGLAKKLAVPLMVFAGVLGAAYIISDIPYAVPRNISKKLNKEIVEMDYISQNALRISKECRKVLRYPAQDIVTGFQARLESQARKKEEYAKTAKEVSSSLKYFTRLHEEISDQRRLVEKCNLETSLSDD